MISEADEQHRGQREARRVTKKYRIKEKEQYSGANKASQSKGSINNSSEADPMNKWWASAMLKNLL